MTLTQIRKHCDNCKMNVMFDNRSADLSNYGSVTLTDKLQCTNCGALDGGTPWFCNIERTGQHTAYCHTHNKSVASVVATECGVTQ